MSTPLIVVTNDDGIQSPGLRTLVSAIADLGEILVVAPLSQQTSMGRAFRGRGHARPITWFVNRRRLRAYAVPTSPAVTVRHAILLIADRTPDLLISGINYGENIGSGITISGTVGAALEAAALGVPAIAASLATPLQYHRTHSTAIDFSHTAEFTRGLARRVLQEGMPRGVAVLNVNMPPGVSARTRWRWTRVSRFSYFQSTVIETPRGKRFGGYELFADRDQVEPDSDIYAVLFDRIASVAPLTLDLTAHTPKKTLEAWRSKKDVAAKRVPRRA